MGGTKSPRRRQLRFVLDERPFHPMSDNANGRLVKDRAWKALVMWTIRE
jgi:hypothetical protein